MLVKNRINKIEFVKEPIEASRVISESRVEIACDNELVALLVEATNQSIQVKIKLFSRMRVLLSLLSKKRPLLAERSLGSNIVNTLLTDLIAAYNRKNLIRRKGKMTYGPSAKDRVSGRAMEPADEIISNNGSGTTRLIGCLIVKLAR